MKSGFFVRAAAAANVFFLFLVCSPEHRGKTAEATAPDVRVHENARDFPPNQLHETTNEYDVDEDTNLAARATEKENSSKGRAQRRGSRPGGVPGRLSARGLLSWRPGVQGQFLAAAVFAAAVGLALWRLANVVWLCFAEPGALRAEVGSDARKLASPANDLQQVCEEMGLGGPRRSEAASLLRVAGDGSSGDWDYESQASRRDTGNVWEVKGDFGLALPRRRLAVFAIVALAALAVIVAITVISSRQGSLGQQVNTFPTLAEHRAGSVSLPTTAEQEAPTASTRRNQASATASPTRAKQASSTAPSITPEQAGSTVPSAMPEKVNSAAPSTTPEKVNSTAPSITPEQANSTVPSTTPNSTASPATPSEGSAASPATANQVEQAALPLEHASLPVTRKASPEYRRGTASCRGRECEVAVGSGPFNHTLSWEQDSRVYKFKLSDADYKLRSPDAWGSQLNEMGERASQAVKFTPLRNTTFTLRLT